MVLDECTRLVADSSEKSSVKIEELNSEIRKLKAMIGKNDDQFFDGVNLYNLNLQ